MEPNPRVSVRREAVVKHSSSQQNQSKQEWDNLLQAQAASLLSQATFCRKNNITINQLNYQKKKRNSLPASQPSKILPLLVKQEKDRSDPGFEKSSHPFIIESITGRRVFVSEKFSSLALKKILALLEGC